MFLIIFFIVVLFGALLLLILHYLLYFLSDGRIALFSDNKTTPHKMDKNTNLNSSFYAIDDDEENDEENSEEMYCPECHCLVDASEQFCPRCGEMLW